MNVLAVADTVIILFILMAVGYAALWTGILDTATTLRLSRFLLNVTLPALLVASMQLPLTLDLIAGIEGVLLVSVGYYAVAFLSAWIVPRALQSPPAEEGVYQFTLVFSNVAFMGFPVVESLLGGEALFYAAVFNLPFSVLIFSVGVLMMTAGRDRRRRFDAWLLINPGIAASLIGVALFLASVRIPPPFIGAIEILGGMTTPLAMVIVGAMLATFPAGDMVKNRKVFLVSGIRLLAIPAALWLILTPLLPDPLILSVVILLAAMPAAANSVLFAGEYGSSPELASQVVFVTTLGSIVTIPLVAVLFV
ncbi:MAG: AEC family transporter [Methanomicrobiaceae archaeon]|nr:AEC family transporter [Methanomicrobiaceae archaeon]